MGLYTNTPGCCEGRIYVVSFGEGIVIIIVVVVVVVAKQPYMIACTYIRIGGTDSCLFNLALDTVCLVWERGFG